MGYPNRNPRNGGMSGELFSGPTIFISVEKRFWLHVHLMLPSNWLTMLFHVVSMAQPHYVQRFGIIPVMGMGICSTLLARLFFQSSVSNSIANSVVGGVDLWPFFFHVGRYLSSCLDSMRQILSRRVVSIIPLLVVASILYGLFFAALGALPNTTIGHRGVLIKIGERLFSPAPNA